MNHSKVIPLRVPMNKRDMMASFDTTFSVWDLKYYICWFGDTLLSKVCKVGALNLGDREHHPTLPGMTGLFLPLEDCFD